MNSFRGGIYAGGHGAEASASRDDYAVEAECSLIDAIMPAVNTGIWEATQGTLRLVSLNFGHTGNPLLTVSNRRLREGVLWNEFVCPLDRDRVSGFLRRTASVGGGKSVDYRVIAADGQLHWIRHHLLQCYSAPDGQAVLRGLVTAIKEEKHLEWECLRISERERNRIGQELHDDLCQVLAGLSYMIQVLGRRASRVDARLGAEIGDLNVHVSDAVKRTRSMAHGLFPAQIKHASLRSALTEFVRQTKERFPAALTLDLPGKLPAHSPEQIIHVYRIVQEAVTNSIRHGKAKAIRIAASAQPDAIRVTVEDDGTGMPLTSPRPGGIGLHVMSYRARILGGDIRFARNSPAGTVVHLRYQAAALRQPGRPRARHKETQPSP